MPCVLVIFVTRKEGISFPEFKRIMEEEMVPIYNDITGELRPIKWIRRYIAHSEGEEHRKEGPLGLPALLVGQQQDIGWDCFCEMFFKDELHLQQYFAMINEEGPAERLLEAESRCSDIHKMKMILMESFSEGEQHVTKKIMGGIS
jgi:hypothetical protein